MRRRLRKQSKSKEGGPSHGMRRSGLAGWLASPPNVSIYICARSLERRKSLIKTSHHSDRGDSVYSSHAWSELALNCANVELILLLGQVAAGAEVGQEAVCQRGREGRRGGGKKGILLKISLVPICMTWLLRTYFRDPSSTHHCSCPPEY